MSPNTAAEGHSVHLSVFISKGGRAGTNSQRSLQSLVPTQRYNYAIVAASIADLDFDGLAAYVVDDDNLINDFGIDNLRPLHWAHCDAGPTVRRFVRGRVRSGHALECIFWL